MKVCSKFSGTDQRNDYLFVAGLYEKISGTTNQPISEYVMDSKHVIINKNVRIENSNFYFKNLTI